MWSKKTQPRKKPGILKKTITFAVDSSAYCNLLQEFSKHEAPNCCCNQHQRRLAYEEEVDVYREMLNVKMNVEQIGQIVNNRLEKLWKRWTTVEGWTDPNQAVLLEHFGRTQRQLPSTSSLSSCHCDWKA